MSSVRHDFYGCWSAHFKCFQHCNQKGHSGREKCFYTRIKAAQPEKINNNMDKIPPYSTVLSYCCTSRVNNLLFLLVTGPHGEPLLEMKEVQIWAKKVELPVFMEEKPNWFDC